VFQQPSRQIRFLARLNTLSQDLQAFSRPRAPFAPAPVKAAIHAHRFFAGLYVSNQDGAPW